MSNEDHCSRPGPSAEVVRRQALQHLASVLGVPQGSLSPTLSLNTELGVTQFDVMCRELKEVADEQLLREMEFGTLLITLHTYCAQMVRCSQIDPAKVARVLGVAGAA